MNAQLAKNILGLRKYIHQVGDRRALIATHVGYSRLQQRLGDGENSLAPELGPFTKPERLHFLLKRSLCHGLLPHALRAGITWFAKTRTTVVRRREARRLRIACSCGHERQYSQRATGAVDDFQGRRDYHRARGRQLIEVGETREPKLV